MTTQPTAGTPAPLSPSGVRVGVQRRPPLAPLALARVAARRLWNHLALTLTVAAGFVTAIAIVVSIPVYAEAVGYQVLRTEVTEGELGTTRPPFAMVYRYLSAQHGPLSWEEYRAAEAYFAGPVAQTLGMPMTDRVRYGASEKLAIYAPGVPDQPLTRVNLAFLTGLEPAVDLLDGAMPVPGTLPAETLVSETLAGKLGLQVGDVYTIRGAARGPADDVEVRVAGVWRPRDPADPYWIYPPATFVETLLTTEESFVAAQARNPALLFVAAWYLTMDGSGVRSGEVVTVRASIERSLEQADAALPGVQLDTSPVGLLDAHQERVDRLTTLLTVLSIPVLGLMAYFVMLVAGLVVQRQSGEIATLRSRGASQGQVLVIYALEGVVVGLAALGLALLVGQGAALAMTWTRSFLQFIPGEPLPIELTPEAVRRGWQMLALLVLACVIPALGAARYTIVSFKRRRGPARPLWQRAYADLLLLAVSAYGYTQLALVGAVAGPGIGGVRGDPFGDPLLLLTPTLFIWGCGLLAVRFFPLLARAVAWVAGWLPGVALVMAARYLARAAGAYTGPLLLLTLTLGLASFTASMARTLDHHLAERVNHLVGGDLRVIDGGTGGGAGQSDGSGVGAGTAVGMPQESGGGQGQSAVRAASWLFLPVDEYRTISGVRAATRVSRSTVEVVVGSTRSEAQFLGVDRAQLPDVVRWRDDYAAESLGELMNRLADDPAGVLVGRDFASTTGLRLGDRLVVQLSDLGAAVDVPMVVVGFVDMFPTAYPGDGPLLIGNLDYAVEQQGGQYPYEVWLRVDEGVTRADIRRGEIELGLNTITKDFAPQILAAERGRPERQGLFGLLSVGFIGAATLTAIGFLIYAALSFQRRFVELGTMRAIGLSSPQLGTLLAAEQALVLAGGMVAGTLVGVTASMLFIPFMHVRDDPRAQIPPFHVEIAWEQIWLIYLVFGILLVAGVAVMLALLRRFQLFQAVKLGETV